MPVVGFVVAVRARVEPTGIDVEPVIVRFVVSVGALPLIVTGIGLDELEPPAESVAVAVITFRPAVVGCQMMLNGEGGVVSVPIGCPFEKN
jgi:hypothetical protein